MVRPRIVRPVLAVHDVSKAVRRRARQGTTSAAAIDHTGGEARGVAAVDGDVSCLILERPVSV
jgi:hypothetical protein